MRRIACGVYVLLQAVVLTAVWRENATFSERQRLRVALNLVITFAVGIRASTASIGSVSLGLIACAKTHTPAIPPSEVDQSNQNVKQKAMLLE